jgi:hypothetical protein
MDEDVSGLKAAHKPSQGLPSKGYPERLHPGQAVTDPPFHRGLVGTRRLYKSGGMM